MTPGSRTSPAPHRRITFESIVHLCLDPEERDKWALLQHLPHLLPRTLDDLTDEEVLWFRVQHAIDRGFAECPKCKTFGYGPFCGHCGHPVAAPVEEHGECLQCRNQGRRVIVRDAYCQACGTPTEDAMFWQELKDGKLNYASLNEKYRTPVGERERRAIENGLGRSYWDADGNPKVARSEADGRAEGQAGVRPNKRRSKRRR